MRFGYATAWLTLTIGSIALIVLTQTLPPDASTSLLEEGGPLETLSAVGYLLAAALLMWHSLVRAPAHWNLCIAVACLGMRELDFHKRFTTKSFLSTRFYTSVEVPTHEKVIGVLICIALLICVGLILKKHLRGFVERLRLHDGFAWSLFGVGVLLALTKSIDGVGRKLEFLGVEAAHYCLQLCVGIEEVFELQAALMLLILVVISARPAEVAYQRSKHV